MNKISCDMCMDLIPLVTDEIASEDSKKAVLEHISSCKKCSMLYKNDFKEEMDSTKVVGKIKKSLAYTVALLLLVGVGFGISISTGQFMFYNVVIMPTIGAISFWLLKKRVYISLIFVFISVYVRMFLDAVFHIIEGEFIYAFVGPLWWATIYTSLTAFGVIVAYLLWYGFKREKGRDENEKST